MEDWTERIEKILDQAPTRAMSFSRLISALREEGVAVAGREDWILKRVVEQPETFRVIPDRLGPWVLRPVDRGAGSSAPHPRTSGWGPGGWDPGGCDPGGWGPRGCDPWIMTCSAASSPFGIEGKVVGRIQESLQAWGREIDDGSQVSVARWIGANKEAERTFVMFLSEETGRA
jgi:hypothetical protein